MRVRLSLVLLTFAGYVVLIVFCFGKAMDALTAGQWLFGLWLIGTLILCARFGAVLGRWLRIEAR